LQKVGSRHGAMIADELSIEVLAAPDEPGGVAAKRVAMAKNVGPAVFNETPRSLFSPTAD